MPAAATVTSLRTGEYLVIDYAPPGRAAQAIGIMLVDTAHDRAYVRFRKDWDELAPDESDVLEGLEAEFERRAAAEGAAAFLATLESTLSADLRTGDRERAMMADPEKTLAELYRRHVRTTVQPFRTHLPLYSARAAATKFSEQQDVVSEDWIEMLDPQLKLDDQMFVARVEGRSMEPRIPSGSLCVFRGGVAGSRQGRLVLVEDRSARGGETERYTIKQYSSEKTASPEGWQHTRILLKPLNPEFEAWELDESGRYAVIAEFVTVLE